MKSGVIPVSSIALSMPNHSQLPMQSLSRYACRPQQAPPLYENAHPIGVLKAPCDAGDTQSTHG